MADHSPPAKAFEKWWESIPPGQDRRPAAAFRAGWVAAIRGLVAFSKDREKNGNCNCANCLEDAAAAFKPVNIDADGREVING